MFSEREQRIRELERSKRAKSAKLKSLELLAKKLSDQTIAMRQFADAQSDAGSGGGSATWTVTVLCQGLGLNGFTITLTLGATTLTATTNFSGVATFTLSTAGTWSGTASKSGFTTQTFSVAFSGSSGSTTVNVFPTPVTISGNVGGGLCLLPASIVVKQSGVTVATTTANSSGNYSVSVPNDGTAYTVTASHPRYDNGITTFSLTSCASTKTVNFILAVSNGYAADGCDFANDSSGCGCCPLPAADTLYINHGGYVITIVSGAGPTPLTVNIPAVSAPFYCGDPVCNNTSQDVTFWFGYGGGQLTVSWARCPLGSTCAPQTIPDSLSGAPSWNPTDIAVNQRVLAHCVSGTNSPFLRTFDGAVTTPLGSGATVTE